MTLPTMIFAAMRSPSIELVLVNYANDTDFEDCIGEFDYPLTIVDYHGRTHYHMAHARNLSIRYASGHHLILSCVDAMLHPDYFVHIREHLTPTIDGLICPRYRGIIVAPREELIAAGGYDERFEFYGPEDKELEARLMRRGVRFGEYSSKYLTIIAHNDKTSNYRLPLSKKEMHHRGLAILRENEEKHVLVANGGKAWGAISAY